MLKVQLLSDSAKVPTLGHPGEDLAYDLYASDSGIIPAKGFHILHTGVAVEFVLNEWQDLKWGFIVKERSSFGQRGLFILGGCVDAGYRGEIHLMLGNISDEDYQVTAGDKIANLIPIPVVAKKIQVTPQLSLALRGEAGFGSTGND